MRIKIKYCPVLLIWAIRSQLTRVIMEFFKWWVPFFFFVKIGDRNDEIMIDFG